MILKKLISLFLVAFVLVAVSYSETQHAKPTPATCYSETQHAKPTHANAVEKRFDLETLLRERLDLEPVFWGSCDFHCGLKPIPPIGCGPQAICACSGSFCKEPCNWVFTNCK